MRALRLHAAGDLRLDEIDAPEVGPGRVGVQVLWAGICGSDLRFYVDGPMAADDVIHPLFGERGPHVLGHEFSGVVETVGDGVQGVAIGDLVVIRPNLWDGTCAACLRGEVNLCANWGFIGIHGGGGGFSEHVAVPADTVHVLPDGVSAEEGALIESLTVAWHAVKRAGEAAHGDVLIVGAGPIGLAILLCLMARGVGSITVSEPSAARAAMARRLGATVLDPTKTDVVATLHARDSQGVDASFDASGFAASTFDTALESLRSGGRCVLAARVHDPVPVDLGQFLFGERTVTGSYSYTDQDFAEVIDAVATGRMDPSVLISNRIDLEDVVEKGFTHLAGSGRSTEVKILVSPQSAAKGRGR